ncbi:MAG: hypothetical protein KDK23_14275 [Leptospiraceae bacterium]|nr:hypothetical protein [Leptospiraceae bacterium]
MAGILMGFALRDEERARILKALGYRDTKDVIDMFRKLRNIQGRSGDVLGALVTGLAVMQGRKGIGPKASERLDELLQSGASEEDAMLQVIGEMGLSLEGMGSPEHMRAIGIAEKDWGDRIAEHQAELRRGNMNQVQRDLEMSRGSGYNMSHVSGSDVIMIDGEIVAASDSKSYGMWQAKQSLPEMFRGPDFTFDDQGRLVHSSWATGILANEHDPSSETVNRRRARDAYEDWDLERIDIQRRYEALEKQGLTIDKWGNRRRSLASALSQLPERTLLKGQMILMDTSGYAKELVRGVHGWFSDDVSEQSYYDGVHRRHAEDYDSMLTTALFFSSFATAGRASPVIQGSTSRVRQAIKKVPQFGRLAKRRSLAGLKRLSPATHRLVTNTRLARRFIGQKYYQFPKLATSLNATGSGFASAFNEGIGNPNSTFESVVRAGTIGAISGAMGTGISHMYGESIGRAAVATGVANVFLQLGNHAQQHGLDGLEWKHFRDAGLDGLISAGAGYVFSKAGLPLQGGELERIPDAAQFFIVDWFGGYVRKRLVRGY